MSATDRRAARTREILRATRALFDERGVRDAQIDDIARAVGINRAIIYRHFSGKEELFALTLVGYLEELAASLREGDRVEDGPAERLATMTRAFLGYGERHPAFVDCAQTLLRRRGDELMEEISESAMLALGSAMTGGLGQVVAVLEAGNASGDFSVPDPELLANIYYTQGFGVLNLATLQLSVREQNPGLPTVDAVPFDRVTDYMVATSVAMARGLTSDA